MPQKAVITLLLSMILLKAVAQDTLDIYNAEQRKHVWEYNSFSILNKKVFDFS